jgi:hypothetical protein
MKKSIVLKSPENCALCGLEMWRSLDLLLSLSMGEMKRRMRDNLVHSCQLTVPPHSSSSPFLLTPPLVPVGIRSFPVRSNFSETTSTHHMHQDVIRMEDNNDFSFPALLHLNMKKLIQLMMMMKSTADELDDDDEYEERAKGRREWERENRKVPKEPKLQKFN